MVVNAEDWGERQRFAMAGELPNRFGRLCLRALAEGAISRPKAAELLGIGIADVDDYMRGVRPLPAGAP